MQHGYRVGRFDVRRFAASLFLLPLCRWTVSCTAPVSECACRLVRRPLPSGASLCCAQLAACPAQPRPVCFGTRFGELLQRSSARLRSSSGSTACSALLPFRTALRLPLASRGRFAWRGSAALSSHCARLHPVRGPCPVLRAVRLRPAPGARCAPVPVASQGGRRPVLLGGFPAAAHAGGAERVPSYRRRFPFLLRLCALG